MEYTFSARHAVSLPLYYLCDHLKLLILLLSSAWTGSDMKCELRVDAAVAENADIHPLTSVGAPRQHVTHTAGRVG